jgi:hypothetical protein
MRIVTNVKLIERNARIGKIVSITGLLILVAGMVISFRNEEQIILSFAALLIGFALSQVGIYYGNRYSRFPRADRALNDALKGLDRQHTIYHDASPVSHLLVGPSGVWVLIPRHQQGKITFEKGRWKQKGGFMLSYMKLFAQESIGRPDLEIGAEIETVNRFLASKLPETTLPAIQAALLFSNPKAEVDAPDAPFPTLPMDKLKKTIRNYSKEKEVRLAPEKAAAIQDALEADTIFEILE